MLSNKYLILDVCSYKRERKYTTAKECFYEAEKPLPLLLSTMIITY